MVPVGDALCSTIYNLTPLVRRALNPIARIVATFPAETHLTGLAALRVAFVWHTLFIATCLSICAVDASATNIFTLAVDAALSEGTGNTGAGKHTLPFTAEAGVAAVYSVARVVYAEPTAAELASRTTGIVAIAFTMTFAVQTVFGFSAFNAITTVCAQAARFIAWSSLRAFDAGAERHAASVGAVLPVGAGAGIVATSSAFTQGAFHATAA